MLKIHSLETINFNYRNVKEIRLKAFKKRRTCPYWEVSVQLRNDPTAKRLTQKSFPIEISTAKCRAGSI